MNADRLSRAPIQFRVTVGADDAPDLFVALSSAKAGRQRVLRFRELAIKGLLIEQLGLQVIAASAATDAAALVAPQTAAAASATTNLATEAIDSWDGDAEDMEQVTLKR